ncbi:MAG: ABC transporter permease [Halosimplex sp.]
MSEERQQSTEAPFRTTSDVEQTRLDRWKRTFDLWVYAPFSVIWSDWRARIGLSIIVVYLLMGTVGVSLVEPTTSLQYEQLVPWFQNWSYPLGTDYLGRDILAMIVYATPPMLEMISAGAIFTIVVAIIVGTLSGYLRGGLIDTVLTLFTDIMINIPGLPLLVVLASIVNPEDPWLVGIILSVNAWAGLARSLRSQVLTLRESSYVEASEIMGLPTRTIIRKDLLPNMMPFILISFTNAARNIIFASVGLYFLGVLPYSSLNWGVILDTAYSNGAIGAIEYAYWIVSPMLTIIGLSIGLVLLSQSLDRVFNPRIRARHANTTETTTPEQ